VAPRSQSFALAALAALAFVLSAARFAWVVDEPWDDSIESLIGPVYHGRVVQVYQRFGFWSVLGAPYWRKLPTPPEMASHQAVFDVPYFRHPPLTFWLAQIAVELGGWSERSFRSFPILLSSATAAMVVALIGAAAGLRWAAAALVLSLALPMSWLVGSMCSYEPCTLAFMTGAFCAHVRWRAASSPAYSVVWILVILAGLSDWSGLAVVPAIWAWELMAPAAQRARLRRTLMLAVPAALSALASSLLIMLWSGGIAAGIESIASTANYATIPVWRPDDWGPADWVVRQGRLWSAMFTLPVGLAAALSFPVMAARCRSATDPLPRAALALLVPAVLNVAAFVNHAYIHEFWWSYALPSVVIAAVYALRGLARTAAAAKARGVAPRLTAAAFVLLVLGAAANGAHSIAARHAADRTDRHRERGRAFNALAGRDDAIAFVTDFNRSAFYVQAWYLDYVAAAGLESFRGIRQLKQRGVLPFERFVAVIPEGSTRDAIGENQERWREVGDLRRLAPSEVLAELPGLAEFAGEGGIWVLTIR
jgi:4-amino-4-deoxy-L-arabinose transferase-like glycosyltransferase